MKRSLITFLLLTILVILTGSKKEAVAQEVKPAKEITAVFARGGDSEKLDPHDVTDGESAKVIKQVFETLVNFKEDSLEIEPGLAEAWTHSDDKLTWTFDLRKNVTFHDGTDFNADAVVFSFQRQYDKNHKAHKGDFSFWNGTFKGVVESVTKTGDYQVAFKLLRPCDPFLNNLTTFFTSIISPTSWDQHQEKIARYPVGTGPWKFDSWNSANKRITLTTNQDYWNKIKDDNKAAFRANKLIFTVVKESATRLSLLRRGDVHLADNMMPQHVSLAEKSDKLKLVKQKSLNTSYLAFNTQKTHMSHPKVRRAIALCLDVKEMTDIAFRGYAEPAVNILPANIWGADPSVKLYGEGLSKEQRIAEAKKLLAEANLPNGLNVTLASFERSRPYMPNAKAVSKYIKSSLAQIGVDIKIDERKWEDYGNHVMNGGHEMCLLGWSSDNGDPDNFLSPLLSGDVARKKPSLNVSFYQNSEVTQWIKEAQRLSSREDRSEIYAKILKQVHEDTPLIPLGHMQQNVVTSAKLDGFHLHLLGVRTIPALYLLDKAPTKVSETSKEGEGGSMMYVILALVALFFIIFFMYSRPRKQA